MVGTSASGVAAGCSDSELGGDAGGGDGGMGDAAGLGPLGDEDEVEASLALLAAALPLLSLGDSAGGHLHNLLWSHSCRSYEQR